MWRLASGRGAIAAMVATIIAGGAVLAPKYEAALAAPRATRPNILLIVSDDQAWSAFDRQLMPTVFSQLVDQGVLFRRAYVNTSLCCPSRSEIMTGLFEHHTGVDANDSPLLRPTLPQSLHDAGYHTMLAGKYLNSWPSCDPRPEFDRSLCVAGEEPSGLSLLNPYINVDGTWTQFTRWQTDVLSEQAADFINTTPVDQPFFVMYTPMSPHLPADDTRYQDMAVTPPRPPSFDVNMLAGGNPLYARRGPLTPEEIVTSDDHFVRMAHSARSLDDSVATLLNSLGDRADNTLVIYLSDNGFLYGEHRRFGKNDAWEESVRVPMAIRYPALLPGSQSYATDALAQNVDVASTIADVAGIPWAADGRSLVPLLIRDRSRVRSAALIERCRADTRGQALCSGISFDGDTTWPAGYQGVVTERFKYVEYDDGTRQLIDLKKDPNELVNLTAVPRFRQTVIRLRAQLRALMGTSVQTTIATGPRGRSTSKSPVFTYFSPSRFSTYRCRLTQDGKSPAWHPCGAEGETLGPLADGHYTFAVAGTDENGRVDPTPASRSFTITSSGPHVEITRAPSQRASGIVRTFRRLPARALVPRPLSARSGGRRWPVDLVRPTDVRRATRWRLAVRGDGARCRHGGVDLASSGMAVPSGCDGSHVPVRETPRPGDTSAICAILVRAERDHVRTLVMCAGRAGSRRVLERPLPSLSAPFRQPSAGGESYRPRG